MSNNQAPEKVIGESLSKNSPRKVYVRGVGAVTALGLSWNESIRRLEEGRSAVAQVRSFDSSGFPCQFAAEIPEGIRKNLNPHEDLRISYIERACAEAMPERPNIPNHRLGVFIGAESGRASFKTIISLAHCSGSGPDFNHDDFGLKARALASKVQFEAISPAAVASWIAKKYDATGPCQTVSLACSSSAIAISEAARSIRLGICDVAICGGVGADVDPLMLAGFGKVSALSTKGVSCPFDVRRDGFIVGEGAAVIILSSDPGPGQENETQVELVGEGRSLDAHHLTAPDPHGKGAEKSMRAALKQANLERVDYVQAHGTSTLLNDSIEAQALVRVFGEKAEIPVSSVKGALGHWIAGAGALGFLCAWEAIRSGTLLPTAGVTHPDPECKIRLVHGKSLQSKTRSALVNSFAFGGANCSLVLRASSDV